MAGKVSEGQDNDCIGYQRLEWDSLYGICCISENQIMNRGVCDWIYQQKAVLQTELILTLKRL